MVRVPSYDSFVAMPQGGGGARFQPTIDERSATAGGRAIEAAGARLSQFGEALQNTIDEARVREADIALSDGVRGLLHDPERGFLNTQGKNAVDGYRAAEEALGGLAATSDSLKTPRQQQLFAAAAAARLGSARNQIAEHTARQADTYNAEQAEAQVKTYADDAASSPFDAPLVASRKALTIKTAERIADLRGMSPEARAVAVSAATTNYHGAVLSSLISRERGTEARAYLAAHEGEISAESLPKFRATVKQATLKSESTDLADTLVAAGGSLSSQLAKLRERYKAGEISADLRDETQQRLEHQDQLNDEARAEYDRGAKEQINSFLANNPNASFEDLPPLLRAEAGRMGYAGGARRFASGRGRGGVRDDPDVLAELQYQAINDPDGFKASFDPRDYGDQLSQRTISKLTGWARGRGGRGAGAAGGGSLKTFENGVKMMSGALAAAGIDTTPTVKDQKGARAWNNFQAAYMWALDDAAETEGNLTDKRVREIGLDLLRDTALAGQSRNAGRTTTSVMRGRRSELLATSYEDIPAAVQSNIFRDLQSRPGGSSISRMRGVPTKGEVLTEYRRRVMRGQQ